MKSITPSTHKRQKAEKKGRTAEFIAAQMLRLKGYKILTQRFKTKAGEIDIIAKKSGTIVFVEVKSRKTLEDGLFSVTARQQERIYTAAELWLAQAERENLDPSQEFAVRFDVIVVAPNQLPDHIMDAFRPGW